MDDIEVEALADRVAELPPESKVDVLLGMLHRTQDEVDRLRDEVGIVDQLRSHIRLLTDVTRDLETERDRLQTTLDTTRARAWEGLKFRTQLAGRAYRLEETRGRLRTAIEGAVLAIETTLTGDNVDMQVTAGELLGRTSAALKEALDASRRGYVAAEHDEPEVQHRHECEHPTAPCTCPRDHLLDEARRIREMCLFAESEFARENQRAVDLKIERDRLRTVCDAVGAESIVDIVTERDRLRLIVERAHDRIGLDERALRTLGVDGLLALVGVLRQDCRDAMVEQDRLRAIVDAVREQRAIVDRLIGKDHEPEAEIGLDEEQWATWRRITEMLDQLDVSPAMGDESVGARIRREGEEARAALIERMGVDPTSPTYDPDECG
jgi:hypothetical protein